MPSLRLSCGAPALRQVCSVRGTLRFALRARVRTVLASVFVWLTTMAASTVSCSARGREQGDPPMPALYSLCSMQP